MTSLLDSIQTAILWFCINNLVGKDGIIMMAMLFAQRVILGKTEFEQVPNKLKQQVADILINECGLPELVTEEYGGTKKVEA